MAMSDHGRLPWLPVPHRRYPPKQWYRQWMRPRLLPMVLARTKPWPDGQVRCLPNLSVGPDECAHHWHHRGNPTRGMYARCPMQLRPVLKHSNHYPRFLLSTRQHHNRWIPRELDLARSALLRELLVRNNAPWGPYRGGSV